MKKAFVALALIVSVAFLAVSCATEQVDTAITGMQIRDGAGNVVTSIDIVSGATDTFHIVPLVAGGAPYEGNLWETVTFLLGRYVDGELYVGDRFTHGEWGGIRVGILRGDDRLTFYLVPGHAGRTAQGVITPGSYEFLVFVINDYAPSPNPPVHQSAYPYITGAVSTTFTVNVLP
jgi:hypothetical protein